MNDLRVLCVAKMPSGVNISVCRRRQFDSNEFAPKRGYYIRFPLNNGERHFDAEWLSPQSGHVSNLRGPTGTVIEPVNA